jgi:hypothetical protein
MRPIWLVALVVLIAACSPSPQESNENVVGGASVSSSTQTPMAQKTTTLSLDTSKAKPGQLALADVLSYSGSKPMITAPDGWTLIRDDSSPSTRQSIYWRIVKANDPNPTWKFSEPVDAQGAIVLLDNVAESSPVDASSGNTGGPGVAAKSMTTTRGGSFVLAFYATDFGGAGLGPRCPANVSSIIDQETSSRGYWIVGTYQNRKGETEDIACPSGQLYNAVAAQVAIARGPATASNQ